MSEKPLSPKMREALAVVTNEWQSAYGLRLSMATLEALRSRGLVERAGGLGSMYSPRTATKWRRKPA
jgi:hypothetical protein